MTAERVTLIISLGGGLRPPSEPPPRTQCEPQDGRGLGPARPRRASRSLRRQSRRSNSVHHVARRVLDRPLAAEHRLQRIEGGLEDALADGLGQLTLALRRAV